MGLVNTVVPLEQLEAETVQWAQEILANSPMALRFLKGIQRRHRRSSWYSTTSWRCNVIVLHN